MTTLPQIKKEVEKLATIYNPKFLKGQALIDFNNSVKSTAQKLLAELKKVKGCGKDTTPDWLIPYICGKTEVYDSPKDDKGKIHYCRDCKSKITELKEKLEKILA